MQPTAYLPAATRGRQQQARQLDELYDQLGRWVSSVFDDSADGLRTWVPLGDVMETPDAYVVDIDLPGVSRDDINVEFDGHELLITGELKEKERTGILRRRTRRIGRFEYRAMLPRDANVDENAVEATLDEGVLTVRIPKNEAAKPRRIEVSGG
jgi:HSP20 family protein